MNSASATHFLYAAYTAVWVIHFAYIGSLLRRFAGVRERKRELGK